MAHEQLIVDPNDGLIEYHQAVINSHIARFRKSYDVFFEKNESRPLVEYFFEKIYSLDGKAKRDEIAVKTYNRFKALLSDRSRERIERLLHLNEITDSLDIKLASALTDHAAWAAQAISKQHLSLDRFSQLYREANTFEERAEQLRLVVWNLESFFELSKHPLADVVIRPAYLAARMVGAKEVFYIFEEGYKATKPVSKDLFNEFLAEVKTREVQFLNEIYGKRIVL